jgi:diguanylate cyclase (GGDEF)-like protein
MDAFSNIKIGTRINVGFGAVIALLVAVAALSAQGLTYIRGHLESYSDLAGDNLLLADLSAEMSNLRRLTIHYIATGADDELRAVRGVAKVIDGILERAKANIQEPGRAALVDEIIEHKNSYLADFGQMVTLSERRDGLVEKLGRLGRDARLGVTEISEQSIAAGDFKAAALAGVVQEELITARLYVNKFLDVNSAEHAKRATDEFAAMDHAVKKLGAVLRNSRHIDQLAKIVAQVDEYETVFGQLVETINARNAVVMHAMVVNGNAIQEKGTAIKSSAEADETALKVKSTAAVAIGTWALTIVAAAAVLLGGVLAWMIGRGIAGPVAGMTRTMSMLAAGDKTVDIPGLGRRDEIGAMAAAVNVFKRNAEELEQLQSQQFEERSRAMETLGKMAHRMQSATNEEEFGDAVRRYPPLVLGDAPGALHKVNASRDYLEILAAWSTTSGVNTTFPLGDCWALRDGRPYVVSTDGRDEPCKHVDAERVTCYRCIPLHAQGDVIGMLYVEGDQCQDPHARSYIEIMAGNIALALSNLRLRESLRNQSIRDPLTSLFNRRYLAESMSVDFARAERGQTAIGVVMFDIDNFKRFNDDCGHDGGDSVVLAIANLLRSTVRKGDVACRYGGDEFVLVLPGADATVVTRRAEELRVLVESLVVRHRGNPLGKITITAGVAVYPSHGGTPDEVLSAADTALMAGKAAGRNRVEIARSSPAAPVRAPRTRATPLSLMSNAVAGAPAAEAVAGI